MADFEGAPEVDDVFFYSSLSFSSISTITFFNLDPMSAPISPFASLVAKLSQAALDAGLSAIPEAAG